MSLKETLDALDKRATQGMLADVRLAHVVTDRRIVGNGVPQDTVTYRPADDQFLTALWNAYRTGQLVVKPEREVVRERLAKTIANAMGDNYADAFKSKDRWVAKRGMSGGRFRDVNEPFQSDYLDAADAALAAIFGDE